MTWYGWRIGSERYTSSGSFKNIIWSVVKILDNHLRIRKLSARWVPRWLDDFEGLFSDVHLQYCRVFVLFHDRRGNMDTLENIRYQIANEIESTFWGIGNELDEDGFVNQGNARGIITQLTSKMNGESVTKTTQDYLNG